MPLALYWLSNRGKHENRTRKQHDVGAHSTNRSSGGHNLHCARVKIVGLTGKAGSGKDHMAKVLHAGLDFYPLALADQLKVNLHVMEGYAMESMYGQRRRKIMRTRMQRYGTDEMKPKHGEDVWCRYLGSWFRVLKDRWGIDRFVIPDVRFAVEAKWIKSRGGIVIRVDGLEREDMTATQRKHRSETEMETIQPYAIVDNTKRDQRGGDRMLYVVRDWIYRGNF